MVGFFGPLGVTVITETIPKEVRGRYMSFLTVFINIGYIYGLFVGILTLDNLSEGNWRALIIWTTIPGFIGLIVAFMHLDETARFDLVKENF